MCQKMHGFAQPEVNVNALVRLHTVPTYHPVRPCLGSVFLVHGEPQRIVPVTLTFFSMAPLQVGNHMGKASIVVWRMKTWISYPTRGHSYFVTEEMTSQGIINENFICFVIIPFFCLFFPSLPYQQLNYATVVMLSLINFSSH